MSSLIYLFLQASTSQLNNAQPAPPSSEAEQEAIHGGSSLGRESLEGSSVQTVPSGTYMDPQERVAKSHEKPSNDIIETWPVSVSYSPH